MRKRIPLPMSPVSSLILIVEGGGQEYRSPVSLRSSRPVLCHREGEVQVKGFLLELADPDQQWEELTFLSFLSYPHSKALERRWRWPLRCKSHPPVEAQHSLVKTHWHFLWPWIKWQLSLCCTLSWVLEKKKTPRNTGTHGNKTLGESKAE